MFTRQHHTHGFKMRKGFPTSLRWCWHSPIKIVKSRVFLFLDLFGVRIPHVVTRWRSHRGPPSKRGRKDDVCDSLGYGRDVHIFPPKNKMALSFRMAATRLGRNRNSGHCQCYNKVERNVQKIFDCCLPLKWIVCMSSSQNGDRSISENERALAFQPGFKHDFESFMGVEFKKKRKWCKEMFKIKHFPTAF